MQKKETKKKKNKQPNKQTKQNLVSVYLFIFVKSIRREKFLLFVTFSEVLKSFINSSNHLYLCFNSEPLSRDFNHLNFTRTSILATFSHDLHDKVDSLIHIYGKSYIKD